MDNIGLELCKYQADLFEKSRKYCSCSSEHFVRKYMKSKLAGRLDRIGFIFESTDIVSCFEELNINQTKNKKQYPSFVLAWAGYLYRYMCYEYKISSIKAFNIISIKELVSLYEAYYSLDVKEAILRIFEAKDIDPNNIFYSITLAKKIYLQ